MTLNIFYNINLVYMQYDIVHLREAFTLKIRPDEHGLNPVRKRKKLLFVAGNPFRGI